MNIKYFSVIFSIAGITILYLISTLSQPALIELREIPDYEGKQVTTEGTVINHYSTKHGSQIITIEDDNITTTVFVEGGLDVEYGDKIRATGEVQKYNDGWEIIVNDERCITIIQKWKDRSIPLWQIAQGPTRYEGLNVNVTGYVDSLYDNYFNLVDAEDEHSLIVFYSSYDAETIYPGQKVNIAGLFKFDKENFRYILTICEEMHKISPEAGE